MNKDFADLERRFIWRRAFRSPQRAVVRSDLVEAFGMSSTKASNLLSSEAAASKGLLERSPQSVHAPPWALAPAQADEVDLMAHLQRGLNDFAFTGLRQDELPVNYVSWSSGLPAQPGALEAIVRAIGQRSGLLVRYVSMRLGDDGSWRRLAPLCLERLADQWRLCAHDMNKPDHPVRTFVLARISEVRDDPKRLPRSLVRANPRDSVQQVPIAFDARLTPSQRSVLENELSVRRGTAEMPSRSVHEFFIHFAQGRPAADVVWPPVRSVG